MGKIRGTHSSPGHYTQITDLQYAAKNFGITTLGLVGETLKGPAFEPIEIKDWEEYVRYFGGTSAEKFKDTLFPKYELPYIAKEYLKASEQLYVCRVLGFSGYDAGPAFIVKATFGGKNYPIAILRSRGSYTEVPPTDDRCNPDKDYDKVKFRCDSVEITNYKSASSVINNCETTYSAENYPFTSTADNKGRFTLVAKNGGTEIGRYPVSLNPGDKDYIYNVLGSDALIGSAALFVEELYDIMLDDLIIANGQGTIMSGVCEKYNKVVHNTKDEVTDFVRTFAQLSLVGNKYLYAPNVYSGATYVEEGGSTPVNGGGDVLFAASNGGNTYTPGIPMVAGQVYEVRQYMDNDVRRYGYFKVEGSACGSMNSDNTVDSILVKSQNKSFFLRLSPQTTSRTTTSSSAAL